MSPDGGRLGLDGEERATPAEALAAGLAAIRAHWLMIAAITFASIGGSLAWMVTHKPQYEARAEILVSPVAQNDQTYLDLPILRASGPDPTRPVTTAADLLDNSVAVNRAAEALGFQRGEVDHAIEVEPVEDGNLVAIVARSPQSERAAAIANAYAEAALAVRGEQLEPLVAAAIDRVEAELALIADPSSAAAQALRARLSSLRTVEASADPTLTITESASAPTSPSGAPRWVTLGVAAFGGLALGVLAALLTELLVPRRATQSADLTDVLPAPVLARIPESRRFSLTAGSPPAPEVREAFRSLRGRLQFRARDGQPAAEAARQSGRVVLMTSATRGDGRTTAALNLADVVTAGGQSAIVLELDLRAPSIARRMEIEGDADLSRLTEPGARLSEGLTYVPGSGGLAVAPAPATADLSLLEALLPLMPRIVSAAAERADWVIIDAPALGEVVDALPVLRHADDVVIVARMGHTTQPAVAHLGELLERAEVVPAGFVAIGGDAPRAPSYNGYPDEALEPGERSAAPAGPAA